MPFGPLEITILGVCGLLVVAVVAAVWVILKKQRKDGP
jgi:hypothetical protein